MKNILSDFDNKFKTVQAWNLTFSHKAQVIYPKNTDELRDIISILKKEKKSFAIKSGECSYDSKSMSSEKSLIIISLKNFCSIKELSSDNNFITVESGMKISNVIEKIIPKNMSLYAVPGGEHVTIGGAISGNVFGKDSNINYSSFGDTVISMKIISYEGKILNINRDDKEFYNYIGSFGFFGIILEAKIKTKKIVSPNLKLKTIPLKNTEDILTELNKEDSDYKYVQLDPFFRKRIFGLAFKASYYESNENLLKKISLNSNHLEKLFFKISAFALNKFTWKIFYFLFFYVNRNKKKINIHNFHYASKYKHMIPLMCKDGLKEYEVIGVKNFKKIIEEIRGFIKLNKIIPIYIVVKKHFKSKNNFYYSFNDNGYSIAFAFARKNFDSVKIKQFKEIVEKNNLKVNLTKTDDFKLDTKYFGNHDIFMSKYKEINLER